MRISGFRRFSMHTIPLFLQGKKKKASKGLQVLGLLRQVQQGQRNHPRFFLPLSWQHQGQKAIHIAQENGARGATVIHGRGSGEAVKSKLFLSMNIEPEKDLVIMLVKKDMAEKIQKEIYDQMDLRSQGKGIIYSLPVNHVAGLVEQNN